MLTLALALLVSQTPAIRRSTPASDDPGMVVRQAGTASVNCTNCGTTIASDGGFLGQVSVGRNAIDGGTGIGVYIEGGTLSVTSSASIAFDGGSIGYMRMPDGGPLEVTVTSGGGGTSSNVNVTNFDGGVFVTSSALPTGASTSALQTTGNTSVASIDTKTPALGQTTMAGSQPVVIASNQSTVPVSLTSTTITGTVAVSGTVTANAGTGTMAVSAASLPLPTGAATETSLAKIPLTQASATAGQSGNLTQGAATTAAPTYTTGTTNPLSLTTTGALRTDSSSTTQPVSGTVAISGTPAVTITSGTTTVTQATGTNLHVVVDTAPTTAVTGPLTDTQLRATPVPVSGTVTAANASVSTTGTAPPGSATLSGGSVTTAAPTYTTGQMNSLSLTTSGGLRVDGSGTTQPVSGTVTANAGTGTMAVSAASLPLPTGAATETSLAKLTQTQASSTTGQSGSLHLGATTTAAPTYTTGTSNALSLTTAGALRTDSSGTTQPVSAASLPLPTGAATSANQTTVGSQTTKLNDGTNSATIKSASTAAVATDTAIVVAISPNNSLTVGNASVGATGTTSPTSAGLAGAKVSTAAPTVVAGNMEPLSLTTSGGLRVDGSGSTQPVSGTVSANLNAGTNYVGKTRITDGTLDTTLLNSAPGSDTGQVAIPVRVISSLASAGSGGTSSNFGSATPAAGTAAGFSDGTNMQLGRTYDTDTGAGTQNTLGASIRVSASGGSTEAAAGAGTTNASTLRVVLPTDQSSIPVTMTSTTITGTVAATQSGTWSTRSQDGAGNALASSTTTPAGTEQALIVRNIPSGTQAVSGTVTATGPLTDTQLRASAVPVSLTSTTVTGTVAVSAASLPLPTGAATETTLAKLPVAQSAALGTNSQVLTGGSVTTAAPTYTTGNINPLSLTTAGALRTDSSGTTQPVSGTVTANAGTGTFTVAGTVTANAGTGTMAVSAASLPLPTGAATEATLTKLPIAQSTALGTNSGAMVQGSVTTAAPTYTTGNINPLSLTTAGALRTDSSGTTQPISGSLTNISGTISLPTGAATEASLVKLPLAQGSATTGQSGTLTQGAVTTAAPAYTTAQTSPLSLTTTGDLRTRPVSTGTVGSATPTATSVTGFTDGTNVQVPRVVDADTSGGTEYLMPTVVRVAAFGGSQPVSFQASGTGVIGLSVAPMVKLSNTVLASAVTCATTATAAPATPLTTRLTATFINNSTVTIYLGGSGVTTSTGIPLLPGASFTDDVDGGGYYCIVASGTANLRLLEQ